MLLYTRYWSWYKSVKLNGDYSHAKPEWSHLHSLQVQEKANTKFLPQKDKHMDWKTDKQKLIIP